MQASAGNRYSEIAAALPRSPVASPSLNASVARSWVVFIGPPCVSTKTVAKSLLVITSEKRSTVARTGRSSGSVIAQKRPIAPTPSTVAASYSSCGTVTRPARNEMQVHQHPVDHAERQVEHPRPGEHAQRDRSHPRHEHGAADPPHARGALREDEGQGEPEHELGGHRGDRIPDRVPEGEGKDLRLRQPHEVGEAHEAAGRPDLRAGHAEIEGVEEGIDGEEQQEEQGGREHAPCRRSVRVPRRTDAPRRGLHAIRYRLRRLTPSRRGAHRGTARNRAGPGTRPRGGGASPRARARRPASRPPRTSPGAPPRTAPCAGAPSRSSPRRAGRTARSADPRDSPPGRQRRCCRWPGRASGETDGPRRRGTRPAPPRPRTPPPRAGARRGRPRHTGARPARPPRIRRAHARGGCPRAAVPAPPRRRATHPGRGGRTTPRRPSLPRCPVTPGRRAPPARGHGSPGRAGPAPAPSAGDRRDGTLRAG